MSAEFAHRDDFLSIDRRGATLDGEIGADFKAGLLGPDTAAVSVRVYTKPDKKAAYRFAVEMMGVIAAEAGAENFPPLEYVRTAGVTMMFPFLRETVANLTMRGRFGAVWIKPFNVNIVLGRSDGVGMPEARSTTGKKRRRPIQGSGTERQP